MRLAQIILAGAATTALVTSAEAQMKISGSTAFRANTHTSITQLFTAGTLRIAHNGAALSGATSATFDGTVASGPLAGQYFTVQTAWAGSEAGIKAVAGPAASNQLYFLPISSLPGTVGTAGVRANVGVGTTPITQPGGERTEVGNANVAMSDTFQASSVFRGNYLGAFYETLQAASVSGVGRVPLGIVPFKFLATTGAPFSNINTQQARALFANGFLVLSQLTGNPADNDGFVYAIGRDPDSGTRLTAQAEIGRGGQAIVQQYEPRFGNARITAAPGSFPASFDADPQLWPAGTVNGIAVAEGNGGYSSGGQLAAATRYLPPAGQKAYLVAYAGTNDADGNIGAAQQPSRELAYNGVTLGISADYSNNTNLTEGNYTFWSFQHMLYRSTADANVRTFADGVAALIYNNNAPVFISEMKVTRATDGGTITTRLF